MIGPELTLQLMVQRLVAGLIIATVQSAAMAAAAVLLGDKGPRHDRRLSAWPTAHIDMLGLGSLMLTGFGWSRALAIDPAQMRCGRWGLVGLVLAGSAAQLLAGYLILKLVIPLLTILPDTAGLAAAAFVRVTSQLCVWMALFSLLPLPPLAGGHFLRAVGIVVPRQTDGYLGWALLIASVLGVTRVVLTPAFELVAPIVLGNDVLR